MKSDPRKILGKVRYALPRMAAFPVMMPSSMKLKGFPATAARPPLRRRLSLGRDPLFGPPLGSR